jgi:hypothetical protein
MLEVGEDGLLQDGACVWVCGDELNQGFFRVHYLLFSINRIKEENLFADRRRLVKQDIWEFT